MVIFVTARCKKLSKDSGKIYVRNSLATVHLQTVCWKGVGVARSIRGERYWTFWAVQYASDLPENSWCCF